MTAATKTDIRAQVLEWVEEQLEMGDSVDDAAKVAAHRLVTERKCKVFVEETAEGTIRDMWRKQNQCARRAAEANGAAASTGSPRINEESLKSPTGVMYASHKVGDRWLAVRECTGEDCRWLQRFYQAQAKGNLRNAHMFGRLADGLKSSQLVPSKFTEEDLHRFLGEFDQGQGA